MTFKERDEDEASTVDITEGLERLEQSRRKVMS